MQPRRTTLKTKVRDIAVSLGTTLTILSACHSHAQSMPARETWPHNLAKKWSVALGKTDAAPTLAGDRLYVFVREPDFVEGTHCLNAEDGTEIWVERYHAGAAADGEIPTGHESTWSSPVLADGKVVTMGLAGTLCYYDADNGKLLWQRRNLEMFPEVFTPRSAVIVDGMCVVHPVESRDKVLAAFDLAKSGERWRWTSDGPSYSSPAVMNLGARFIIVQTDQKVVALNATNGTPVWQTDYTPRLAAYNVASPLVDGDVLIYSGQNRGATAVKLERTGTNFVSKEMWSNRDLNWQYNRPLIKDGLLYALTDDGRYICVNASTGRTAWLETAGGHGPYGSIVDAGSALFALTPDGQLTVIALDQKAFTQLAKIKVSDKPTFATPVISGNRVFIQDQETLTLWTIE